MDMDLNEDYSHQKVVKKPVNSNPKSTKRATKFASSKVNKKSKPTAKDEHKHSSLFAEGGLPDKTRVAYVSEGKKVLKGYKQGKGIFCFCCRTVISASQFEAHAGWSTRRKPYENIFTEKGISLHAYTYILKFTGKHPVKKNDDMCRVCKKGRDLLFCEGCPRSFHRECMPKTRPLLEKWFCKYCQDSMKCLKRIPKDVVDGTLSGSSSFEEVIKSCIRLINLDSLETHELVACALCRSCEFNEDGFTDKTAIVCEQCELEFHIGCLREHCIANLKALPPGSWFCSEECRRLNYVLEVLVTCGAQKVPDSLVSNMPNLNLNWIIVRGKNASEEDKLLLSEAAAVFQDGFQQITDVITGSDMLKAMIYGQKMGASDFAGMHCAMLLAESKVITAVLFRVFGHETAELPIVATSQQYKRKGYFKLFFTCFERLLSFLKVKKLVVPAAKEAKSMWTKKFGFRRITPLERTEYRNKQTAMVAFSDTCLLEKDVPKSGITFENNAFFSLSMG
ncbi:hypothetical protein QVD17_11653 [Tagetes erecta]|uniref:PHD-type domain-containing protein n=1 Tax=Tagetes erecta TaxID=13708 RepID=A0AAD8KVK2_TARER|nr:hypothetical protein QVD17_11653 [Tagetes erecta]